MTTSSTESSSQPQGVGATGGLPGANADPRAAELPDTETRDTVAGGETATPTGVENVDPAYASDGTLDHGYDEDPSEGGTAGT